LANVHRWDGGAINAAAPRAEEIAASLRCSRRQLRAMKTGFAAGFSTPDEGNQEDALTLHAT
jgi:hypothetical protein